MSDPDLVASYLRAVEAFNDGDLATFMELVAPDVVYIAHGQNLISGVYHGIEQFGSVLARAKDLTDDTISGDPVAVVSDNERWVMIWGRLTASRSIPSSGSVHDRRLASLFLFSGLG